MKLLKGTSVTILLAIGTYFIGLNVLHPWQRLQFTPSSNFEFILAVALAIVVASVCAWRLRVGAAPGTELDRFIDALSDAGVDDPS